MSSRRERVLSWPPTPLDGPPEPTASLLASIVNSSGDAIFSSDLDGVITSWNKGAERLFRYAADETVGKPIRMLFPPERQADEAAIGERIKRGERIEHYETVRQRKNGSFVEISLAVSPIMTPEGYFIGTSRIAHDISDRKKNQELIIRELQHRTLNLFAVFQAIVARIADESKTAEEVKYALNHRIQALAQAYRLTAAEGASLASIIERKLDGFSKRVNVGGCDIVVNASAAQQFALIIHEL